MARRPQPTELKIMQGVKPSRINHNEPEAPKGLPDPPEYLDEVGVATWHRMGALLDKMGVMSHADAEALALYCVAHSDYVEAIRALETGGKVINTATTTKPSPWVQLKNEAYKQKMKVLIEFGFTPSARAGIKVVEDTSNDPILLHMQEGK